MNNQFVFLLRLLRKVVRQTGLFHYSPSTQGGLSNIVCDQKGNDAIFDYLENHIGGCMMSKWGTIELSQALITYKEKCGFTLSDIRKMIEGNFPIPSTNGNYSLYNNAGVFPLSAKMANNFGKQALIDCQEINILGSYIPNEKYLSNIMDKIDLKVNLDAFYAPWLFQNPWTKWLKGKKVLVVHPFVESITYQYNQNRELLFDNPDVLPEFKSLSCIKAVQTQVGEQSFFKDWFEALNYMKVQINKCDYDVAIIGCGAYGMSLAAHVKRQGKVALHLAGWTQMLFGVYGERWISHQPKYSKVINKYWIRPNENETPKKASNVEGACYW